MRTVLPLAGAQTRKLTVVLPVAMNSPSVMEEMVEPAQGWAPVGLMDLMTEPEEPAGASVLSSEVWAPSKSVIPLAEVKLFLRLLGAL